MWSSVRRRDAPAYPRHASVTWPCQGNLSFLSLHAVERWTIPCLQFPSCAAGNIQLFSYHPMNPSYGSGPSSSSTRKPDLKKKLVVVGDGEDLYFIHCDPANS